MSTSELARLEAERDALRKIIEAPRSLEAVEAEIKAVKATELRAAALAEARRLDPDYDARLARAEAAVVEAQAAYDAALAAAARRKRSLAGLDVPPEVRSQPGYRELDPALETRGAPPDPRFDLEGIVTVPFGGLVLEPNDPGMREVAAAGEALDRATGRQRALKSFPMRAYRAVEAAAEAEANQRTPAERLGLARPTSHPAADGDTIFERLRARHASKAVA